METKNPKKNISKYCCKNCDYTTSNKKDYNKHLLTRKHLGNQLETEKSPSNIFMCENCNKAYKNRDGLWKHNKKCIKIDSQVKIDDKNEIISLPISNNFINESNIYQVIQNLMKENCDLKNIITEQMKQTNEICEAVKNNNVSNNYYNTTNNKTFNLQVFLNETCKDAMNIMDFVNSMEINLDDLEKVGELGYVNGMTNIIIKNLKALDITKRPLHCTDVLREIMYIKDENKWEKETDNKDRIKKALKYIMHKNAKMLNVFKEKYPDCIKSYSKRSDQYNKLVVEVLGGKGDNEPQHNEKIIRRIAREVTIDRSL